MAEPSTPAPNDRPTRRADFGETFQMVKDYARQETVGPLKGAGRWIAAGAAGAVLIGIGASFVALGLLRMLQTEIDMFDGRLASAWPYLFAFLLLVAIIVAAVFRIKGRTLQKGGRR